MTAVALPWEQRRLRLVSILEKRSFRRQKVVLASGRESDFYVDARLTTLNGEGAALVAGLILDRLRPDVLAIGGPVTGADPIVLGESVNTLTTYGYDPVTGMQEPKATLCQIRAA